MTTATYTGASSGVGEWRRGGWLVFAALLGVSLSSIQIYSTGLMIAPLEAEFGWSRTKITSGLAIVSIIGVVLSPFMGALIDRWGSRNVALPGVIMFCSALAALGLAGPSIWSWWLLWALLGLTLVWLKPTVWSASVSAAFSKHRGLALAIAFMGSGLGSSLVPALTEHFLALYGWRGAYLALGGGAFIVTFPFIWLFFRDPRKEGLVDRRDNTPAPPPVIGGWTLKEGMRKRQFYQLCIAAFLNTLVVVGFIVHIVPILTESGVERQSAVNMMGLVGLCSILGRITMGVLLDRVSGPAVAFVSACLPVFAAILLLAFPGQTTVALVAIVFLGLCIGGEYDAIIYLASRYFGLKKFGSLFGYVVSGLVAGVGLGPLVGGIVHDRFENYDVFLYGVIPAASLAAVMLGSLGRYPDHDAEIPAESATT